MSSVAKIRLAALVLGLLAFGVNAETLVLDRVRIVDPISAEASGPTIAHFPIG